MAAAAAAPALPLEGPLMHTNSANSGFGPSNSHVQSVLSSCVDSVFSSHASSDSSFVVSGQLPVEIELKFRKIFKQCDVSRCGAFNECELIMSCSKSPEVANFFGLPQALYQGDGSLEMVTKMFQAIDVDEDHEITWEEFHSFFAARFAAVMALQQQQQQQLAAATAAAAAVAAPVEPPVAPAPAAAPVEAAAAPVSETREAGTCAFCGKRLGWIFGIAGCGMHKRAHEAKCQQRQLATQKQETVQAQTRMDKGGVKSSSSVETDVPEGSPMVSAVTDTYTSGVRQ